MRGCESWASGGRRACAARRSRPSPASAPITTCGSSASLGTDVDDPRIAQLVGELSLASESFRRFWARHDVKPLAGTMVRMRHPQVGMLELRREKLSIGDSDGQLLVIHHAEPDSGSARSLARLVSLAATGKAPGTAAERAAQP